MICPNCHSAIGEQKKFCGKCGAALGTVTSAEVPAVRSSLRCAKCGIGVSPGEKFCGVCGGAIGAEVESRHVKRGSPTMFVSIASAVALLVSGAAWYFFGSGLHAKNSFGRDLIDIPSVEGTRLIDALNGRSIGEAYGIQWIHASGEQGAGFTVANSSRIEYLGTAEIFSTDVQGGDVTWPGTTQAVRLEKR